MKKEFNNGRKLKTTIESNFVKIPNNIFNVLETLTTGELILVKYFLKNQSNVLTISVNNLSEKLNMTERNVIRAMKGLTEKHILIYSGEIYQLNTKEIPTQEKEVPTDNKILSSEEPKVENDIPTEVEEIVEPAVENEPKIEQMETSTENCFIDENGKKYSVTDIRGLLDITFIEDIPNYRTILFKYGVPHFFQEYGKDYFLPEELPTFYEMTCWYLKNY